MRKPGVLGVSALPGKGFGRQEAGILAKRLSQLQEICAKAAGTDRKKGADTACV